MLNINTSANLVPNANRKRDLPAVPRLQSGEVRQWRHKPPQPEASQSPEQQAISSILFEVQGEWLYGTKLRYKYQEARELQVFNQMYIDNSCKNCCFKPTMYNLNRLKTRMTSGNVCMLLSMNVVSWRVAKYKNPGKRNFNTSPWQIYDLRSQKGYRAIANTFFVPMLISWGKGPRSQMLLIINPFSKVELSWLGLKLHC